VLNIIKNKKADISINMIIIIAIGLIVFVLVVALLVGKVKIFNIATSGCVENNGECVGKVEDCNAKVSHAYSCPEKDKPYCCIDLGLT